ncbi:MAG: hypothetical protein JSS83_16560 [Cyanobacteria bacterium SZAS LIN-3]|nr:hypothetical protein [Cyanobacteria bacterium SZAS LIN-3]
MAQARRESCPKKPPDFGYYQSINDIVVGSIPLDQGDRYSEKEHFERTAIVFDVDRAGHFSNFKTTELSGSLARDFWTLYATMTCPPMKPPDFIAAPVSASVSSYRIMQVSNKEAEDWRIELGSTISRRLEARSVYFPLIPASFIALLPNTVSITDISDRSNIVGIAVSRLCPEGKKYWSQADVGELITGQGEISKFLQEWPQFLKNKLQPSREEIIAFAGQLKRKYSKLLEQGEPVAPFP